MEATVSMVMLWALFAGTHIGLATTPVRSTLVARLGERGFSLLFSLVAAVSFTILVSYYAMHRFDGPPGLAVGGVAPARWVLMTLMVGAFGLMLGSLSAYPRSPYALFSDGTTSEPRGVERITRHGFFAATAVFAVAHVLLATHLIGAIFAGGFAVLALLGAWHQDRKFLARRGERYAAYLAVTSTLPFGAILAGRQRLVVRELPLVTMGVGAGLGIVLRLVHEHIFAWGGLGVVAVVVGGAAVETVQSLRRERRHTARALAPSAGTESLS